METISEAIKKTKKEWKKIYEGKAKPCNCSKCICHKCKSRNLRLIKQTFREALGLYRLEDWWVCQDCRVVFKKNLGKQDKLSSRAKMSLLMKKDPIKKPIRKFNKKMSFPYKD